MNFPIEIKNRILLKNPSFKGKTFLLLKFFRKWKLLLFVYLLALEILQSVKMIIHLTSMKTALVLASLPLQLSVPIAIRREGP